MKKHIFLIPALLLLLVGGDASFCFAQATVFGKDQPGVQTFHTPKSQTLSDFVVRNAAQKTIVGLGESSHYTRECYTLKQEIIRALMQEGFDGLVLEVDFGQALIWNDYVLNGKGDLDTLLGQSGWFTYRTQEFREVLQMIREFNLQSEEQFQVYGMEMTSMGPNLEWMRDFVRSGPVPDQDLLQKLHAPEQTVAFSRFSETEIREYWDLYFGLRNWLDQHETVLQNHHSASELAIAERICEITRQFATYIAQDDFSLQIAFRDDFSARNLLWALQQNGEEGQLVLWAHNGHVAHESILFNYEVIGHHLTQWFGEDYYSIGFTFNQGKVGTFSNEGFKNFEFSALDTVSLTQSFHQLNSPFALLDVQAGLRSNSSPSYFLRTPQLTRTDVSEFRQDNAFETMEINLSSTFDAYIYIEEAHTPTSIPWIQE